MKTKKMILLTGLTACLTAFGLSAFEARAHMLWLNPRADTVKVNEPVYIEIGWGHKLPRDEFISPALLEGLSVLDPQGKPVEVKEIFPYLYRFVPSREGVYLAGAKIRPGFLSATPRGKQRGSRRDVDKAVSCFRFIMTAKTRVCVGRSDRGYDKKNDDILQLIPLKNPTAISKGDTLAVRVLFEGAPLANAVLQASHPDHGRDGFADMWIQTKETDAEGIAEITLDADGPWVLRANHKTPYSEPDVCDENSYSTTLTVFP